MKHFLPTKTALLILFTLCGFLVSGQDFDWKNGNTTINMAGTYGTQGTPAAANTPGSRKDAISWTDASGNFWLFGGYGYDDTGNYDVLNDLWKYTTGTNEWTWVKGSNAVNQLGTYGTLGNFGAANVPGARRGSVAWKDASGNLWLFGGRGYDAVGSYGELNDLWLYDITTNQWKWVKGSNACYQNGTYGTQGTAAAANIPGGRYNATAWTDASGNFWLFGGYGFATGANQGDLNDLWRYSPATNQWTWMKGSNGVNVFGTYGTQSTGAVANTPGGRATASGWTDLSGNLWLHGGYGFSSSGAANLLSDLWQYNMTTNQWTWFKGYNTNTTQQGTYGTQGTPATPNLPGARYSSVTWTDGLGDLWLFAGYGFATTALPDYMNDLWRYDIAANQWTWVKGSNITMQQGIYGIQGVPSPFNIPGGRGSSVSWKDGSNNLWLFGGAGYDAAASAGDMNDLWKFFNCIDPIVTITTPSGSVCAGAPTILTANGAMTYTWIGGQQTSSIVVAPLGTSDYTVNGTDANECKGSGSYTLNIWFLPAVIANNTSSLVCAGESTSLFATGALTYSWSNIGTGSVVAVIPTATTIYSVTGTDANGCSNSAIVQQQVAACVGIAENGMTNGGISVYPNPSQGAFTLRMEQTGPAHLTIFNALGQNVFEQVVENEQTLVHPQLAKGLYHYQVSRSQTVIASGKLVVEF